MIFLDSDILIDFMRSFPPCLEWLEKEEETILISGFTCLELYNGCLNKSEIQKLEKIFKKMHIYWPDEETSLKAMNSFKELRISHGIGMFDCLIGHSALKLGLPIYSFNEKHYKKIPDLRVIKPYKK
jgi:hypothetical protein